jgi:hypothetical protein
MMPFVVARAGRRRREEGHSASGPARMRHRDIWHPACSQHEPHWQPEPQPAPRNAPVGIETESRRAVAVMGES